MMVYVAKSDWDMLALKIIVVWFQCLFEDWIHEIFMSMLHVFFIRKILLKEKFAANLLCTLVNKDSEQEKNIIFYRTALLTLFFRDIIFYRTATCWEMILHQS